MDAFSLHPQLIKDCVTLGNLPLCRVLLMNNRLFPWLILVPQRDDITEIFELESQAQSTLMEEISFVGSALKAVTAADKINVASLGNQVPQLHTHIIARFRKDTAWPHPVWGHASEPYDKNQLESEVTRMRHAFGLTATA